MVNNKEVNSLIRNENKLLFKNEKVIVILCGILLKIIEF